MSYRLALQNAGFDGFRVFVVNQVHQYSARETQGGLEVTPRFYATLLNAIIAGDLLTMLRYQLAPYERAPGMVEDAIELCVQECEKALRAGERAGWWQKLPRLGKSDWPHVLAALKGRNIHAALQRCRKIIEERVEVDFLRPRPVVKITGEFWAQTTEGDGNFRMFSFLEQEGAEVLVEPVSTWIDYTLHMAGVRENDVRKTAKLEPTLAGRIRRQARSRAKMWLLKGVQRLFQRAYETRRRALGGTTPKLASQLQLQRMGHPYYNSRCGGGEGHLEVAKNIYYTLNKLAHMVLSLKPFGCMPSTQSDGAQAAVMAQYPDMIFLPIETSGEGDINAHSRVQMALGEAQAKARAEFDEAIARAGLTLEEARKFVEERRELRHPLRQIASEGEYVGRAARFVQHLARIGKP
jgi:predicted nucleotide-binding protein (sugar kinase/HSP70/actin superfamily)